MSGRERHGVFISYARQDGEAAARALHARLAADAPDLSTWLDRNDVEGGVGWWTQIEQQLDRAEFLILIMTPAALRSENTRREWRSARQRGVCVYPVVATSGDSIDYDLEFVFDVAGTKVAMLFTGSWQNAASTPVLDDQMPLEGWSVFWLTPTSSKTASGTILDFAATPAPDRWADLRALRKYIADAPRQR